jgi:hypothetical protein
MMKISKVIGLVSCLVSCLVSGLAVGAMSPSSVNTGLYLRGSLGVGGMISPDVAEVLPVFTPDMGLRHDNSMSRGGVVYAATLGYLHFSITPNTFFTQQMPRHWCRITFFIMNKHG